MATILFGTTDIINWRNAAHVRVVTLLSSFIRFSNTLSYFFFFLTTGLSHSINIKNKTVLVTLVSLSDPLAAYRLASK